jgi:glutamate-1-semialdehyde 2,1-aminomutase
MLGIEPDIAVYAKAMSNGYPAGAIVGKNEVMDASNNSFISSSYWTDGVGTAASLACIGKMRRESVQKHLWSLGERLQTGLSEVASRYPTLGLKIGGMPCAPSIVFANSSAKPLMIRHMLQRGYLISSQLYVTWCHDDEKVAGMLAALDESLALVSQATLDTAEAPQQGFARLV